MNLADLNKVALAMVTPGKGILAADESSGTIKKRFDAIKVESTEESRRDYREMLFRSAEAMSKHISGVILYDETIWQTARDGGDDQVVQAAAAGIQHRGPGQQDQEGADDRRNGQTLHQGRARPESRLIGSGRSGEGNPAATNVF